MYAFPSTSQIVRPSPARDEQRGATDRLERADGTADAAHHDLSRAVVEPQLVRAPSGL